MAALRAERSLARVSGLPANVRAAALRRFTTCRDVLQATELDLIDALDLFLPEVRLLLQAVARHVAPPPPSALTLLGQAATSSHLSAAAVPTGLAALDAHLGGGLPMRAVTELVGPAGSGKTQLCSSVAAHALLAGAAEGTRVIYIDTEGSFSAKRLLQLLRTLGAPSAMDQAGATTEAAPALAPSLARGVPFCTVVSQQLELEMLTPPRVGLLIVDSIAMAAHRGFDREGNVLRRQSAVVAHAARLKLYADAFATCVLCVNQVAAGPVAGYGRGEVGDVGAVLGQDDAQLHAYLGTAWAHSVNVRLAIEHAARYDAAFTRQATLPPPPPPGAVHAPAAKTMVLRVAKAPLCAEAAFAYTVGASLDARPL